MAGGTMSQQDWANLAAAAAAGGTDYLELEAAIKNGGSAYLQALAAQKAAELQGIPDAGAGAPGSAATAKSSQFTVGQDAITYIEETSPDLAWLLNVPELAPLIISWAQNNTSPTDIITQFESTGWYKTHSDATRKWLQEVQTDPAQATADLQAQQSSVGATLAALGLQATPQQVQLLAQQSLALGWTDQQIKDNIAQNTIANANGTFSFKYGGVTSGATKTGGTLASTMQGIHAEAAKYLVPISDSTAQSFATQIAQGTMDSSAVDAYLQTQAESLYPSISGAIKNGVTPADYVSPYKEVAAQLLGVNPNSIDMMQSKWNRALTQPGEKGVPQAMSLYDWQQLLMKDPQYNYLGSINAKDRASSIAQGLGEMFGKTPSGPSGSTAFAAAGAPRIPGVPIT